MQMQKQIKQAKPDKIVRSSARPYWPMLGFSSPPAVHNAPAKHLLGFEKVSLEPGQAGVVAFKVDVCRDLSVVDELGNRKVALGSHTLHVGDLKHTLNLRV